jgi:hypothetical protein
MMAEERMIPITERVYEKRDSTERFKATEHNGPESKYPEHKVWKMTSQKTGKVELASNQDLHLWYRVIPPAEPKAEAKE